MAKESRALCSRPNNLEPANHQNREKTLPRAGCCSRCARPSTRPCPPRAPPALLAPRPCALGAPPRPTAAHAGRRPAAASGDWRTTHSGTVLRKRFVAIQKQQALGVAAAGADGVLARITAVVFTVADRSAHPPVEPGTLHTMELPCASALWQFRSSSRSGRGRRGRRDRHSGTESPWIPGVPPTSSRASPCPCPQSSSNRTRIATAHALRIVLGVCIALGVCVARGPPTAAHPALAD